MSTPLITLTSRAICLMDPNIDTDIIFPARFLLKIDRDGMDDCLFRDRRFDATGRMVPDHPFNDPDLREAQVLIAGPGFGCGSSREQAVWALVDWGIRVVIAPDFGDIFAGNARKNGLLLVTLPEAACEDLARQAQAGGVFALDLPERSLSLSGKEVARLDLSASALQAFLEGWDEIDVILNREMPAVRAFEASHRAAQPWLYAGEG
ncbi:3-isopropylmalate dehydratase small subunit [Falsirhodobacter halotolerans]|uniref:3-isopropylmalate dehydratase small subunit n=1 Tax=Falsirhodobacter halotolerans TaxID=1146892 RepID=UPI001FD03FD5|nr:3-isopropylmalate dehydratase small subunit [Falsirhodobacter halotolerans]MCJ8141029.1 3-isopropylmalate dehydratase small subunit [Falsirhodobacter halotolerans]